MHTHRFGKKVKLPATIAIKHQLMKLLFEDLMKQDLIKDNLVKETRAMARPEELPEEFAGRATNLDKPVAAGTMI
jgi:hypothetical protein